MFCAQCQQLTGQTVLTSSVSFTAAGSEIWVFFAALQSVVAAALVRDFSCTRAWGGHEQALFWEHRSFSVHDMLHASLFWLFRVVDICILSLSWPRLNWSDFHVCWYALWRRAAWRHRVVFRSTSQMLWCPSNSRRWLLYTSDSVMHSIVSVSFKLCDVVFCSSFSSCWRWVSVLSHCCMYLCSRR
jgi:hypothetical protein